MINFDAEKEYQLTKPLNCGQKEEITCRCRP